MNCLAEWTGLEPATPGVTGRYSNQLNYHSMLFWFSLPVRAAVVQFAAKGGMITNPAA
jgi:hypothetical protein